MCALHESFLQMEVNGRFRKYHPGVSVKGNGKRWWHYAQTAVVQQLVRPYSWQRIYEHRQTYRKYKSYYKIKLLQEHPADVEEEMELLEDKLSVLNILLAREEARLEVVTYLFTCSHPKGKRILQGLFLVEQFAEENPESAVKYRSETPWWKWWSNISNEEEDLQVDIISEKRSNLWSELTAEEKAQLYVAIGYDSAAKTQSKPKQYIGT